MRKQFNLLSLTLFVLFSLVAVSAQAAPPYQIDNASFENWGGGTFDNTATLSAPWTGANIEQVGMQFAVVYPHTETAHSGKYSAKLMDRKVGAMGITETSPSWVTLGKPWSYISGIDSKTATAGTDGGVNFTARPDAMEVWIIRKSNGKEHINLLYYAWNGTAKGHKYKAKNGSCSDTGTHTDEESDIRQQEDPNICGTDQSANHIADGLFQTYETYNNWTKITVPIRYKNDDIPTKMNIILSASTYPEGRADGPLYDGNYMLVDDVKLIYKSTIQELKINNEPLYGFKEDRLNYMVELGEKATDSDIPKNIVCKRSGRTLSGSEIVVKHATKLGEPTTITVKAEDGSSTTTYTVTFVRNLSVNSLAEAIYVNGEAVPGFNSNVTAYDVTVPYGTAQAPAITVTKAEEAQTVEVESCSNFPCVAKVKVYAENLNISTTYTLNLKWGKLTDNTLQNILINGNPITGFNPTQNRYTVEIPLGTTQDPTIQAVSNYPDGAQTIQITNNGLNGSSSTVKVTPQEGDPRTYIITYKITESSYSYLKNIMLDGVGIEGFEPSKTDYNITLPVGTTTLPTITWEQGDAYQTVVPTYNGVNGVSRITVTAQNKQNTTNYRLSFTVQKSTNNKLNNLLVDGVAISGFDPNVTDYTYNVNPAATSRPVVTWEAGDAYQVVTKNPASEATATIEGVTKVTARAQDDSRTVYNITFTQQLSDNAKLADLSVEGNTLSPVFSADQTDYTCQLQRGTTVLPAINVVKGDATQSVRIEENGVNGTAKITVKAQKGNSMVYTIAFSVPTSSDVTLKDILVGGESVQGFDPATLTYTITLPAGTTALPSIEGVKNDASQRVIINKGGVNGTTTLRVVAENGAEQTYNLVFSVEKSLNATLKNIVVGDVDLPGFDPEVLDYTYVLSSDVTRCPIVEAEGYAGQTITITMPQLLGTARIEVQPEVGGKNVYTIRFVNQMSDNNQLADIQVNGSTIAGFDAAVTNYQVELPLGTTALPVVTYTKADANQTVQLIQPALNGPTQLVVKAENGSINTYTINFSVAHSDNALLDAIYLDGNLINEFAATTFNYQITLPAGTTTLPVVTYKKGDEAQRVIASMPQAAGVTTLQVISEDGTQTNTYTVAVAVAPFEDATLKNILADGVTIDGFNPDVTAYTLNVVNGNAAPAITYQKQDATQQVVVNNQGLLGCTLTVTAQNGATSTYVINYNVVPNGKALLKDIQTYKASSFVSIDGFDAATFEYNITLPWRTTTLPVINPVASAKGQVITLTEGSVNGTTTIHVLADDGSEATYQLHFAVEQSNNASLSNILIGGNYLEEFKADQLDYVVTLPYGTTQAPVIEYENGTKDGVAITEQQIVLTAGGIKGVSSIQVTSQDGSATQTYTIRFNVAESDKPNQLARLLAGNVQVPLQDGVFNYDVTLPYGTTSLPNLVYDKNYKEQEVRVAKMGYGYKVTVVANKANTADVVYTLNCKVAPSPQSLLGVELKNGATLYPAFDPNVTQYIAKVNEKEDATALYDDVLNVVKIVESTDKKFVVTLTSKTNPSSSITHTIYYYYQNDVVPNGEFNDWTTAQYNNAIKPTGWNVPADATASGGITAKTGSEIQKTSESVVGIKTSKYLDLGWAGSIIPAFMTTGTVTGALAVSAGTHFEVSGGVTFRNTPQAITIGYNFPTKKGDGALFGIRFYAGTTEYNYDYIVKTQTSNYTEYTKQLDLDGKNITSMNLIVNATNQFKGDNGTNKNGARINIDYIRLVYNKSLTSMTVNGVQATRNGNSFAATIDTEFFGTPATTFKGEVPDQAYEVIWGEEKNGVRTATVRCYAEDTSYNDYTLTVTRKQSTDNTLKELVVAGAESMVFNPATLQYDVVLPYAQNTLPDVSAAANSNYATVTISGVNNLNTTNASTLSIVVTPDKADAAAKEYKVNFTKQAPSSDATLKNLVVEGYDIAYDATKLTYDVTLPAGTTVMPAVSFEKQLDDQNVVMTLGTTTTLLVTAQDGTTQQTYQVVFNVEAAAPTTAQLSLLEIDNALPLQPAFSSEEYNYTTSLTDNNPAAVVYGKVATDKLVMQLTDEMATLVLDNLNGVTHQYQVSYAKLPSNNALLQDILADGASVEHFASANFDYEVPCTEGQVIDLEPVLMEEGQTMTITFDQAAQMYSIVVTSPDKSVDQTYTVTLVAPVNNNADLAGILINGVMIDEFDKDKLDYTVNLPVENPKWTEPAMPSIEAIAGTKGQTIEVEVNDLNEVTYITVTAPDGKTQKVYELAINAKPSNNAYLASIAANYDVLPLFEPTNLAYSIEVAASEERPVITYQKGDGFQQVTEVESGDKYLLEVTAQDGTTKNVYEITFVTVYNNNAQLAGITLDGELLSGFEPNTYEYDVELPVGTTVLPIIGVINGADGQTTQVVTNGVNGDAVITVTADDGVTSQDYTIHFSVKQSDVDTLLDIQVDGESIFVPDQYEYTVLLEVGTRVWPMVTWTAGDAYQTVTPAENELDTWNKVVTLVTLAQDGLHSKTYTVNLQVAKSNNAALKDIQLDNESYAGFEPETTEYTIELPIGTTTYPEVTYTEGDAYQSVEKVVNGNVVTLYVVAEDGSDRTYTLTFEILHSSNAQLSGIYVNDELIDNFDPATLDYNYVLPYGTTEMPEVTYEKGDKWQVVATNSGGINGNYTLHVVAEDGISENVYIIYFSVAKSDNALLSDILVDGVSIGDFDTEVYFDAEIYTYNVGIPYGQTVIPTIKGVASMESQIIEEVQATSVNEVSTITVIAEDGTTKNQYTISWYNKPSTNNKLNMIYLDGESLDKFDKEEWEYHVTLPYGTTQLPTITWDKGDEDQTVNLSIEDKLALITVTAQNGDQFDYYIYFTIEKSTENRLKNIYINGKQLEGFDPEQTEYDFVYPAGTPVEDVPTLEDVTYEVFDPIETVTPMNNDLTLILRVTAENGDIRTYVITQSIALHDNSYLADIQINGESLPDFEPEKLEYVYKLPFGSTSVPEDIVYISDDPTQRVTIAINQLGMPTEIFVTAEDGSKSVYRIHFMVDDFDPTTAPTADNVCITSQPDGSWKFTTNCANVTLYLVTLDGKVLVQAPLELVDPNVPNICSDEAEGYVYDAGIDNIIAYYFMHNMKTVVASGKFRVSHQ